MADEQSDTKPKEADPTQAGDEPAAGSHSAADPEAGQTDKADDTNGSDTPSPRRVRLQRMIQVAGTLLGFIAGLVLAPYAEELIVKSNPGFFGPDNQQIIEDQRANFAALDEALKAQRLQAGDDPETAAMITDLEQLVATQKGLAMRKDEMFKETDIAKQRLDDQLREAKGHSTAVDFWLAPGESVILKDEDTSFTVVTHYSLRNDINVALRGQKQRIDVGDVLPITIDGEKFVVIYREGRRESDGRYGFDFARATNDQPAASP